MAEAQAPAQEKTALNGYQDELRSLIAQIEYLRDQVATVNAIIDDLVGSLQIIEYISKEGQGKTVLVPIGAGNFIKAKIEDTQSIVMSIGGRMSIETNPEDAKKLIENRISTLENYRLDLLRKLEEINRKINEILPKVQKESRKQ